jgi:hypothetical protein
VATCMGHVAIYVILMVIGVISLTTIYPLNIPKKEHEKGFITIITIIFATKKIFMNKKEYDLLIVGAGIYGASDDLGRRA